VWQTERPFELHLDGITITGRADVILDHEGDLVTRLAIVDYKTSVTGDGDNDLQLQVYADAGRSEGLDVRGAYVHDLRGRRRTAVDVSPEVIRVAETKVTSIVRRLQEREFSPHRGPGCARCDVRTLCVTG
jgi:DNA helicase-2/ATP-dependent DNA helicase PcrA